MEDRNETVDVMFPSLTTTVGAGVLNEDSSWQQLGTNALYNENSIDLAGFVREEMTFAIFETMMQDPGLYLSEVAGGGAPGTGNRLMVMEVVTDVPMSEANLLTTVENFVSRAPGMLETDQDFIQIIYGNLRTYVPNTTLNLPGYFQLVESSGFGSKEPTASATLYCYKIVQLTGGAPTDTLQIPASRIGLAGRIYREAERPYFMRLKRSYELQQLV